MSDQKKVQSQSLTEAISKVLEDYSIRKATPSDVSEILAWLKQEFDEEGKGFWCHRDSIASSGADICALIENKTDKPVAFCQGGLVGGGGFFEVRPNMRRKGLGTLLFDHCLEQAKKEERLGLWIRCTSDSVRFWEKCGFENFEELGNEFNAVLPISYCVTMPEHSEIAAVQIDLYDERNPTQVVSSHQCEAAVCRSGDYLLATPFIVYTPSQDIFIRILINGQEQSNDKIKYSLPIGVRYDCPFVALERIVLNDASR